jgi:hypothetical protein
MIEQEARQVCKVIKNESPRTLVDLKRLGNGEWVCIIFNSYYVWCEKDWVRYAKTMRIRRKPQVLL